MAQNNPQAVIDLAFRSTHVRRSGRKGDRRTLLQSHADEVVLHGLLGRRREAMMESATLPLDFDGIIAGAPSLAPSRNVMDWLWANRQMTDRSVVPALGKSQPSRSGSSIGDREMRLERWGERWIDWGPARL